MSIHPLPSTTRPARDFIRERDALSRSGRDGRRTTLDCAPRPTRRRDGSPAFMVVSGSNTRPRLQHQYLHLQPQYGYARRIEWPASDILSGTRTAGDQPLETGTILY